MSAGSPYSQLTENSYLLLSQTLGSVGGSGIKLFHQREVVADYEATVEAYREVPHSSEDVPVLVESER